MLFLLDKNVRTVKWNGIPLHEASSAIVKEEINGDLYLTVRYPITDSGIYQLIKEDMLIKAPVPVLGAQLFRIKKPIENDDTIDITAYHISDDIMRRSINPVKVVGQSCAIALSQMVQNAKTDLGDFSFTSDISDNRTFNTTETETLYSVLMDGKHSIVGTWEGELVRDNFALSIKRSRGANRGVIITTHKNLKSYQRTKNSQNVVTRIHARSTFKPEGAEDEVALKVTVDSPLINSYPYINEKEYENNNAKTIDDLRKWAEAKFKNDGIDKVSDAIKIEAYELDGQVVHLGDTVNLKSRKHSADLHKKAIAYEFNALTEEYISITFDDKPGVGGSGMSSGLSNAADAILGASATAQDVAIERALKNADAAFDAEFDKRSEAIKDDIEKIKAHAEAIKAAMTDQLNLKINQSKSEVTDRLQKEFDQKLSSASADLAGVRANLTQAQSRFSGDISQIQSDIAAIRGKQSQADNELAKQVQSINQAKSELAGVKTNLTQAQSQLNSNISQIRSDVGSIRNQQTLYEQSNTQNLARITGQLGDKASKAEVKQTADGIREELASLSVGENLFVNSEFKNLRDSRQRYTANGKTYQNMIAPYWYNPYNAGIPNAQNIQHGYFDTETFSDTVFAFNESDGSRHWKALSTDFKIGVISAGEYYFSADLYAADLGTYIVVGFHYHDASGRMNFYSGRKRIDVTEKGRWTRLGIDLKVNDDIDLTKKVQFYIYGYNFSTNSILYLKKPKVSKGRLKSDWSPALEDTEGLIIEAKATFERTAQGLRMDLSAVQAYVSADGTRSEALRTYSREETARQLTAERKAIESGYVAKATYAEDVKGISRRFEELVVGGRNLMGVFNTTPVKSTFEPDTYRFTAKTTRNTTKPTLQLQFRWTDGSYSAVITISETGQFARKFKITKPYSELRIKFNCNKEDAVLLFTGRPFIEQNTDYYFTGDLINLSPNDSQADFLKIEKATITSDWSPAPEDAKSYADTKLAEYKQGIDGQLASVQAAINTANSSLTSFNTWKQSAQETLNKVGRVEAGLNETKTSFAEIKQTAQGLRTDLTAIQSYVNADGTRSEALRTYSREETARQLIAERKAIEDGYVGKATYAEDVKGISRRFEELKSSSDTKLAEFKQGIDGQFATMSSQIGETIKKTDISITPGQITFGTGKVVNGQTLASLLVQNPESMEAITKLMRITGNLIVDGSITGRDLAAGAITTPHLAAGAVTVEVLGANAVTADKVKADDALLEKLSAGEALLRKLMAKDAFVNRLQSIDFTAEQVKGGMIKALNGALKIDLNNGQYNVMTDQAAIRRVLNGYPNQFLKFTSEIEGGAPASVTVLGANRDGTENSKNDSFAGIRLFSGNKVERTEIISDVVRFATGAVNYRGWEMRTLYGNDNRQVILQPFGNVTRSNIVANYFNGIDLVNVLETLNQMMANLGNHTGRHDIFGPIRGLGARKYVK